MRIVDVRVLEPGETYSAPAANFGYVRRTAEERTLLLVTDEQDEIPVDPGLRSKLELALRALPAGREPPKMPPPPARRTSG